MYFIRSCGLPCSREMCHFTNLVFHSPIAYVAMIKHNGKAENYVSRCFVVIQIFCVCVREVGLSQKSESHESMKWSF